MFTLYQLTPFEYSVVMPGEKEVYVNTNYHSIKVYGVEYKIYHGTSPNTAQSIVNGLMYVRRILFPHLDQGCEMVWKVDKDDPYPLFRLKYSEKRYLSSCPTIKNQRAIFWLEVDGKEWSSTPHVIACTITFASTYKICVECVDSEHHLAGFGSILQWFIKLHKHT
jgi:hypothetical protein